MANAVLIWFEDGLFLIVKIQAELTAFVWQTSEEENSVDAGAQQRAQQQWAQK